MSKHPSLAAQLFLAYEARNWVKARKLLTDDAVMLWPATRERFDGGDNIIHVNRVYPEGWKITVLEGNVLTDGRLHTVVRVDHAEGAFFASSTAALRDGKICKLVEYWGTAEEPPAWRIDLPGWMRTP
jgi:hypothetical protein